VRRDQLAIGMSGPFEHRPEHGERARRDTGASSDHRPASRFGPDIPLLLPVATSRWKRTTSLRVNDATSLRPFSVLTWRSIFKRSVSQLDASLFGFAAG